MLNPNARSLYTTALTPPPGMVFDEAIGTTFSTDPVVLLSVPVHLALLRANQTNEMQDGITVLEAMRRLSNRITVYAQRGRIQVPSTKNVLYAMLEAMVVEVAAPHGGVFHPKFWLLCFINPTEPNSVLLRFMVLSRNITADRSWDVALTLEGKPSGTLFDENRSIGELIQQLPEMAFDEADQAQKDQAERLSNELWRATWEPPTGFESVRFHVLGLKRRKWCPRNSKRLVVISPYCTDQALQQLAGTTDSAEALVTRPETFAELGMKAKALFHRLFVLDEAAETEDGEEVENASTKDTFGLHAKIYVFERGWNTHVVLGSANATNAALLAGKNVEVLAEVIGKRSRVGGVESLLNSDNMGEVLVELQESDEWPIVDGINRKAEADLEAARNAIAGAHLRIRCGEGSEKDVWEVRLEDLKGEIKPLEGIDSARAWPITVGDEHATSLVSLVEDGYVKLGEFALESLTSLIAFELHALANNQKVRFALNLPIEALPEGRKAAIMKTVIRNREGFLRYLLLLLGDLGYGATSPSADGSQTSSLWGTVGFGGVPLLEELVRAYAREPCRLTEVGRVVQQLIDECNEAPIIPEDFLETWRIFQRAMERRDG